MKEGSERKSMGSEDSAKTLPALRPSTHLKINLRKASGKNLGILMLQETHN
jgi:hypothetical protein